MPQQDTRYELTLRDLDQLHDAVMERSKNCFELKKLCTTILVSGSALIATFTHKRLNYAYFAGAGLTVVFFWILDSQSYFYQDKMRAVMKELALSLQSTSGSAEVVGTGLPLADVRSKETRLRRSLLNSSMIFYLLLASVDGLLTLLLRLGFLGS